MAEQLRTLKDMTLNCECYFCQGLGGEECYVRIKLSELKDEARKWLQELKGDKLKLISTAELEMDKQFLNMKFDYCIHWIEHFFNIDNNDPTVAELRKEKDEFDNRDDVEE